MPDTISPMSTSSSSSSSRRPGGGWWRRWRAITVTRGDLITFLVAAALCSASYYLAIRKNGLNTFGKADSPVLVPGAAAAAPPSSSWPCGSDARADEPLQLDFETHHSAENAGLSVSANSSAAGGPTTTTTGARRRRALSGAVAWAGSSGRGGAEAAAAGARR